ncbi:MAG: T9SS type A sorting domain-containing protein [bacterium]
MRLDYSIGNGSVNYASVSRSIAGSFEQAEIFSLWLTGDGSDSSLNIRFYIDVMHYWYYDLFPDTTDSITVNISLDAFSANYQATDINPAMSKSLAFSVNKGNGDFGGGSVYFDNIQFKTGNGTSVPDVTDISVPDDFILYPNYPNPFNAVTSIKYSLSEIFRVKISIYNVSGQMIETLVDAKRNPGTYTTEWNAENVSSGIYFYRLGAETATLIKKCILLK